MKKATKVYLMGIGGIAMANLAGIFKTLGHEVEGSEGGSIYPPSSELLERLNIKVYSPYKEENLSYSSPDFVVIGNVVRATNPEARWVLEKGISYKSLPSSLEDLFLENQKSLVVSGTHGKSTTTGLLAWTLEKIGKDPSAFVGAFVKEWNCGYRVGNGDFVVIEGDEYDTAFFDKRPKFLHYRPYGAIVTGIEFDHGDIYKNLDEIRGAFKKFISLLPSDGVLVINYDEPYREELSRNCKAKVITYGSSEKADWRMLSYECKNGQSFIGIGNDYHGKLEIVSPLIGKHNGMNLLAVVALLSELGFDPLAISKALETFPGVRRRQEVILNSKGIVLIDDFAHHPTAVRETLLAIRAGYKDRRIIVVFEPRTNTSKRKFFQHVYPSSFEEADIVLLKAPADYFSIKEEERIDIEALTRDVAKQKGVAQSKCFYDVSSIANYLEGEVTSGDVVVFMSNGSMDQLPKLIKEMFIERK